MSFDVRALASRKHRETGHAEVDWAKALESARLSLKFIDIDFASLELIALASRSPEKFTTMTRLIYQYGKSHPHGDQIAELLIGFVDASPFSLVEWVDATDHFQRWLEAQGRKVDFLPMLKYLECCVASPDAREGGQTFEQLLDDFLKVSGYEG
jgi:hypothetical protein